MRLAAALLMTGLGACAPFPVIETSIDAAARAAPFPTLSPLAPVLAEAATSTQITDASVVSADARIAGLRARAAGLQGQVIDPALRTRMTAGVDTATLR
jgi:hypothetical protein